MIETLSVAYPLREFLRDPNHYTEQVRLDQPIVLTVDGKERLVVLDAEAYRTMLEQIDRAEAIAGIRRGLASFERGEGRLATEVFEEIREPPADSG